MKYRIALVGNPNSGKTTLFNQLTGSNQYVGNWPGVTVEKKEGRLRNHKDVIITDLPGIYSLSPYTLEEVVARNYLIDERPDAILNIVDGTNIERNLYLTTQLTELGIPVVVAINMMDVVQQNGDTIRTDILAEKLACQVVEISALKGTGIKKAADAALEAAQTGKAVPVHTFSGPVEHALAHIEEAALHDLPQEDQRWYAIKLFEGDEKVLEALKLPKKTLDHIQSDIDRAEAELDDDAESIITNERYLYIQEILKGAYQKKNKGKLSASDKIDRIVTNRWLALPIFALIMYLVYATAMTGIGSVATDWANEGLFGDGFHLFGIGTAQYEEAMEAYQEPAAIQEAFASAAAEKGLKPEEAKELTTKAIIHGEKGQIIKEFDVDFQDYMAVKDMEEPDPTAYGRWVPGIPPIVEDLLVNMGVADWMQSLILDGIVAGVGAVLGFVPQMLVLFLMLAFLESCGYMARVAFIMDRVFRRFGLSGKSFIPMLIGTGCSVPGIMASRTIENDRDRKMTIITTSFIPCGAKLPVIALIAGALFGDQAWVAFSAYIIGITAVILSGIMLKKTNRFAGDPSPFVMELPDYRLPTLNAILRSTWERGWSFIKKAGSIILLSTIVLWFLASYGFSDGALVMVEDMDASFMAAVGNSFAWIFKPLGFGNWQSAVATVTGLIAKENVVATFGVMFGQDGIAENGWQIWQALASFYTPLAGYSFLLFNLLCAPCFAAIGAIKREMNNTHWTLFALAYQTILAYASSLVFYQLGSWFVGEGNVLGTAAAIVILGSFLYFLLRSAPQASLEMNFKRVEE